MSFFKELKHPLSKKDLAELQAELAAKTLDLANAKTRKKEANARFRMEINPLQDFVDTAAQKIAQGYEVREVECENRKDHEAGRIETIRLDTGEVIESREMTEEERQISLEEAA